MKTDLSSQIKLDRIPRRYFCPDSEIELTAIRREEKIDTHVFETANEGGIFLLLKSLNISTALSMPKANVFLPSVQATVLIESMQVLSSFIRKAGWISRMS